ncbi:MAG: hypothetical protein R6X09_12680 [Bacteroidales bacterium]
MQLNLTWKKGFFSNTYTLFKNGEMNGYLREKTFSQTAVAELNGKSYLFRTKGFFKQRTEIIDFSTNQLIGEISYNNWKNKATISNMNKTVYWSYNNIWNTKWSLSDPDGTEIKFAGSSTKGYIESNTDDALLILSGLYVTNYYWQMSVAVMVAVFVPIWISVLN